MKIRVLLGAGLALLVTGAVELANAKPDPTKAAKKKGRKEYVQYCASCHGNHGRGDGLISQALKTPPPDLTLITKRHGAFDVEEIRKTIDGRKRIIAHGSTEMPVWGTRLKNVVPGRETYKERFAQNRIALLIRYLKSIQQKP